MQITPIKKFEKISTEIKNSQQLVVTKITDYKNGSVIYEVFDSGKKHFFKTLKDARDHIRNTPGEASVPLFKMDAIKN